MTKLQFGILGCGNAAVPVCEALAASSQAQIVAACDLNPDLARDIGQRFGAPPTTQVEALLSDPQVQAVYVAVPHHRLAGLTKQALLAGKHVLVEKPLALTLAEVDELIALSEANNLALGVFYEMRYSAPFAYARQLIQEGAIGRVISVRIHTLIDKPAAYWQVGWGGRSVAPWRGRKAEAGGGVVLMNTSHFLDATWYMTGLEVTSVAAEIGSLVAQVEVEDTCAAALRYANGAIGSLYSGAHIVGAHSAERCEVFGTTGQISVPDPYVGGNLRVYLQQSWRDLPGLAWTTIAEEETQVYERAVDGFVEAVQAGAPAPIGARDARRVLATVLAIYQSAAEGRRVEL